MAGKPIARGRTAEIYAWETGKIIKVYLPEFERKTATFEADIAVKVQDSGIACPHFFGMTEMEGRPALIYERIDGLTMAEIMGKSPWRIPQLARRMAHLHLQMHQPVITAELPSQREKYTQRIETSGIIPADLKTTLLQKLAELPDERRLCHGDFHPANVISTPAHDLSIDWIDVSIGHPLADVARTSILLKGVAATERNPVLKLAVQLFHATYLREYFKTGGDQSIYRAYLPIVAAARLWEGITELQDWLLEQAQT